MGYLDLHSHVLPGLDDGSPDSPTTMTMLRGLSAIGFDTVFATPHQKSGQFMPSREAIDDAHAATRAALAEENVELELGLAAENMWDDVLYQRIEEDRIPSYGGGPAFLIEFQPSRLPIGLMDHLFRLRMKGRLPVIAHPERYEPLWSDAALLERLGDECALVVDLGAVAGYHGRKRKKAARNMVERGIAHAAASDAHGTADIRVAAAGIEWIRKKLGQAGVDRLLDTNPRRIVVGEHPDG